MKKILTLIMILSISVQAAEFHISPQGADSNVGTKEKPFRTLVKARDKMRRLATTDGKVRIIILGGGTYRLSKTFELNERDSNTLYQGANGEDVRISGGIEISAKDLKPLSDN